MTCASCCLSSPATISVEPGRRGSVEGFKRGDGRRFPQRGFFDGLLKGVRGCGVNRVKVFSVLGGDDLSDSFYGGAGVRTGAS